MPKGNSSSRKSSCYQERDIRINDQLPQLFGALHGGPTLVSLYPQTSKAEICRDSWEQEKRVGATSISPTARTIEVPCDLLCRETQLVSLPRTPWCFHGFLPTGFCVCRCQPPESPSAPCNPLPEPKVPAGTPGLCCVWVQDSNLDPCSWSPPLHLNSRLTAPVVHLQAPGLPPNTGLQSHEGTCGKILQHQCGHCGKQYGGSSKTKNGTTVWSSNPSSEYTGNS